MTIRAGRIISSQKGENSSFLGALTIYTALATIGAKWLVLFKAGGFQLELSNFGTLMLIGLLGLSVLTYRELRAPMPLIVLGVLLFLFMASFKIKGQEVNIIFMSMAGTLGAWSVANCVGLRNSGPVFWAFVTFFGFFVLSAMIAKVDLIGGFLDYVATQNRDRFNFWVLRPVYNAFVGGGDTPQDDAFRTQLNNAVAATYSLFYILAGSYALNGERRMIPVAILSIMIVFMIFSSSAVLTCLTTTLVFAVYYLRNAKGMLGCYVIGTLLVLGLFWVGPGLESFLESNVADDSATREGRLIQYSEALDSIEEHILYGAGLIRVHGHYVHNFFLFAFASIGIVGALAAGYLFFYAIALSVLGFRLILSGVAQRPETLMVTCLPILFVIRASFGGGGGLPTGAGLVAFALALVARRALPPSPVKVQPVAPSPQAAAWRAEISP